MAISFFCITLIDLTGVLDASSVFDDDMSGAASTFSPSPVEITLFVVASVYLVLVGIRMARIIHSYVLAWGMRLADILVVITLLVYLFSYLHS